MIWILKIINIKKIEKIFVKNFQYFNTYTHTFKRKQNTMARRSPYAGKMGGIGSQDIQVLDHGFYTVKHGHGSGNIYASNGTLLTERTLGMFSNMTHGGIRMGGIDMDEAVSLDRFHKLNAMGAFSGAGGGGGGSGHHHHGGGGGHHRHGGGGGHHHHGGGGGHHRHGGGGSGGHGALPYAKAEPIKKARQHSKSAKISMSVGIVDGVVIRERHQLFFACPRCRTQNMTTLKTPPGGVQLCSCSASSCGTVSVRT